MTYRGTVQGGMVVLEKGAALPDGTVVTVAPVETTSKTASKNDALFRMSELAVETGVDDLATNVDHYLYGHPKAGDAE